MLTRGLRMTGFVTVFSVLLVSSGLGAADPPLASQSRIEAALESIMTPDRPREDGLAREQLARYSSHSRSSSHHSSRSRSSSHRGHSSHRSRRSHAGEGFLLAAMRLKIDPAQPSAARIAADPELARIGRSTSDT
jgi:hypothetical protein